MKTAYFDCFSGASGDMMVGALLDAGCDAKELLRGLKRLPVKGYRIEISKVQRGGFAGTRFEVHVAGERKATRGQDHHHDHGRGHSHEHAHEVPHGHGHDHPHRTIREIESILRRGKLPKPVHARALAAFHAIAKVESKAHGIPANKVHFHEVGAVDTIVDIVAAAYAIEILSIEAIHASTLPMGHGFVHCDHGHVPVPVPGTIGLMHGVPVRLGGAPTGELVTPTGAALLTSWAKTIGEKITMRPTAVGYGAGKRDRHEVANLLRVVLGETVAAGGLESDQVYLLEANLDDISGELVGHAMERLFEEGALDVWVTPIQMKKSRPGVILSALVPPAKRLEAESVFFAETSTLGVRRQLVERTKLPREIVTLKTPLGPVPCKVATGPDGRKRVSPEYDALRAIARRLRKPLPEILAALKLPQG